MDGSVSQATVDETTPQESSAEESSVTQTDLNEQFPSLTPTTMAPNNLPVFVKIRLKETDDILLFESNSYTVLADTDDAKIVEEDNRRCDEFAISRGKQRKVIDVETQTVDALLKTRAVNTDHIRQKTTGTFVSNYDMFDTYANLNHTTESISINDDGSERTLNVTTYSKSGNNVLNESLERSQPFRFSSLILQRILAGNVFEESQRRYRNMEMPNPLDPAIEYLYRIKLLHKYRSMETVGAAVSCMSFCPANTDILAIGYGVYKFVDASGRRAGSVCVWNMKNPVNAERFYKYSVPVTSVAFSMENPQLLAVGLFDGSVQVIDITEDMCSSHVAISQRKTSRPVEAVWQIKWIKIASDEELLSVSQDGFVMKYSLVNSPFLIGRQQLQLHRVEGSVEGLPVTHENAPKVAANRHSQGLVLQMNPIDSTIYYVGTDEGCLHECTVLYPYQHLNVMRVHKYGVFSMEFSPYSPKIFLTCGTDWYIRVWIEGIMESIIELRHGFEAIHCAAWCPSNATVIACVTRSRLILWDIKTNSLRPAAEHNIKDLNGDDEITVFQFTNCGRSLVIGTESGVTLVYALEDMPFAPHFQYKALELAIFKNLASKPDLEPQVRRLGYLGYSKTNSTNTMDDA